MDEEQPLEGGNASGEVVRAGDTVRKPWTDSTPSVLDFMTAVRDAGVDVPAALGKDELGRQVIEFVPGQLALHALPLTLAELSRVGAMVRAIHDASEAYTPARDAVWSTAIPAPGDDLVCHNDLAPWNLIVGERCVFIDWDAAAPSTRLWDLAYAAQAFTLSDVTVAPEDAARSLAAFIDGYSAGLELRAELASAMHRRAVAMYDLLEGSHDTGREPWSSMYESGHGEHWRAASDYVGRHRDVWERALHSPAGERPPATPA